MDYESLLTITIFFVLLNALMESKLRRRQQKPKQYSKKRLYKSFVDLFMSLLFVIVVLFEVFNDRLSNFLSGMLVIVFLYYVGDTLHTIRDLNRIKQA